VLGKASSTLLQYGLLSATVVDAVENVKTHQHSIFEYSRLLLILHIEISNYCTATDLCMQPKDDVPFPLVCWECRQLITQMVGHDVECLPGLIASAHSIIRHLQMKESKCLCFCFS
jgi:hypothetical protein